MPIVSGKKHTCPDCGALAFGIIGIGEVWDGRGHLRLACESCGTSCYGFLPALHKKVLYLDQHAISLMMRSRETGREDRWSKLFNDLKSMVQLQRIICPMSWEHREESEFSVSRCSGLMETCRILAMGTRLRGPWEIQTRQIREALQAFVKSEEATFQFESKDAFENNPHAWHNPITIEVNLSLEREQIDEWRQGKMHVHGVLESLFSDPPYLKGSFNEHVQRETEGLAKSLIGTLEKARQQMFCRHKQPDPLALLCLPDVQDVLMVLKELPEKADEFFSSPQFANIPVVRINAILLAAMARNSYRKPKQSDPCDLQVISAYMPYCDAMLIDREMRSLAIQGEVHLDSTYGTKLYSGKTLPQLHEWLGELEASFPSQHKDAVSAVYDGRFDRMTLHKGRN